MKNLLTFLNYIKRTEDLITVLDTQELEASKDFAEAVLAERERLGAFLKMHDLEEILQSNPQCGDALIAASRHAFLIPQMIFEPVTCPVIHTSAMFLPFGRQFFNIQWEPDPVEFQKHRGFLILLCGKRIHLGPWKQLNIPLDLSFNSSSALRQSADNLINYNCLALNPSRNPSPN